MTDAGDGFLLTLPLYSYLIEPGPRPGFLQEQEHGTLFVPLWTDSDLFDRFLREAGLAGRVSGLRIHSREELIAYLESVPATVENLMIDPSAGKRPIILSYRIRDVLEQLRRTDGLSR